MMVSNDFLIEIIIPNWDGEKLLKDCLLSLRKQTVKNFKVTVVDNGSVDGSLTMIAQEFPDVKTLCFDHNTGFSVAVNRGIKESRSPWLLLLNNDMEVAEDCLEMLCGAVERYAEYDFFALKMINFHQRDLIDGAGDGVLRGGAGYRLGTMERDSSFFKDDRDCFGACAGAALYKRDLFSRVGLFDTDFFAYLEDVDFNMRARRAGMSCRFISSAKVYHIGSASSGSKINDFTIRLSTRNNIYVLVKNYSFLLFLRFLPAIAVYQFMWALFCCKKGMLQPYFAGLFQAAKNLSVVYGKSRDFFKKNELIDQRAFKDLILFSEREVVDSIMNRRSAAAKGNFFLRCYKALFF